MQVITHRSGHGTVRVNAAHVDRVMSRGYSLDGVQRELADASEGMAIDWSDLGYAASCIALASIEFGESDALAYMAAVRDGRLTGT